MSDKDPKAGTEPEIAEPTQTPDAPAADVPKPEAKREEVIAATDAIDDVPEEEALATEVEDAEAPAAKKPAKKPAAKKAKAAADEPKAEKPAAEKPAAEKPASKKAAAAKPADKSSRRKPNGKVVRDKHGRPVVDGPVVAAHAKYVRTSARKARLVCDHIRGKSVDEAVAILAHTPRAVAEDWEKLLKSAVANAEHNHELLGDDLKILAVFADEGPTLKRFRPRAMGRATPIRKRTSHLTIQLTPKEQ